MTEKINACMVNNKHLLPYSSHENQIIQLLQLFVKNKKNHFSFLTLTEIILCIFYIFKQNAQVTFNTLLKTAAVI